MKVFVSSTVYDLIDVRAEVAAHLRSMGIIPVMSDDKTSGFEVANDTNSIQACLVNLEDCDEVVAILDRRYGPSLGPFGFEDVSATHLEIRHARQKRIPLRVYARDRLDADFAIWKRNNRSNEIALPWAGKDSSRLLPLLDELAQLRAGDTPNWYTTFRDSRDLKEDLSKYFSPKLIERSLAEAIAENKFPLTVVDVDYEIQTNALDGLKAIVTANIRNVSNTVAFNFNAYWMHQPHGDPVLPILPAGESFAMSFIGHIQHPNKTVGQKLIVEYDSLLGISTVDTFQIAITQVSAVALARTGKLLERKYRAGKPPILSVSRNE